MRLWCYFFGHRLIRPKSTNGKPGFYATCKRCKTLMVRDYFDGWQPASSHEKAHYQRTVVDKLDSTDVIKRRK